jgi:hypothetical protein
MHTRLRLRNLKVDLGVACTMRNIKLDLEQGGTRGFCTLFCLLKEGTVGEFCEEYCEVLPFMQGGRLY